MNRQLRRTTKKSDRKRDKEQERRKDKRRQRRQNVRAQMRSSGTKTANKPSQQASKGERLGGRRQLLTGILALMTISLLVMNSIFPPEYTNDLMPYLMGALSYALLGYFGNLWLRRRGQRQPWAWVLMVGLGLAMGTQFVNILRTEGPVDILLPYLSLPGLLLGIFIAEQVYKAEQRF
ncbi:MAG: hypothetical protein AAF708_12595 [Deinococcota bacterium]